MFSFSHLLLSFQRENILRLNLRNNGREVNIIPLLGSDDSQKDQYVMSRRVSINRRNASIAEILTEACKPFGIQYAITPQGITISYDGSAESLHSH